MLAPMRIRAEPPPVFAGERFAARDRRRPLAKMAHSDEARQARRKFLTIGRLRRKSFGERKASYAQIVSTFLSADVGVKGEIRCQFIILSRKDGPTPDFPHADGLIRIRFWLTGHHG